MEKQKPSRSAGILAAHRAFESSKHHDKRICHDPFAKRFLPPGFTVIGESPIPEETALDMFREIVPGFHEFFLARTRYIDDYLLKMSTKGLEQVVILGAGYDSRAYRFDAFINNITVFEVDHPATQAVKKEKIKQICQGMPNHVKFVPLDFHQDHLSTCLSENGYDKNLTTLFIWEGVTMYITSNAVDETLTFISQNNGKGSAVIFDYTCPEVIEGTCELKEAMEWIKITEKSGEPLLFGIANDEVEPFLTKRGFSNIVTITNEFFKTHYFVGVNKGRQSTPILAIAHAEIDN